MAKHTWNSAPPRLWPILRLAAERSWDITVTRPTEGRIRLRLERDPARDPILTAEWGFWYDTQPGRNQPGRWKFTTAQVRSRADSRPVTTNLRDLPRLLMEADRAT